MSTHAVHVSGIGPKEHLTQVGIETKVDLPGVGLNLQDHTFFHMYFNSKKVLCLCYIVIFQR